MYVCAAMVNPVHMEILAIIYTQNDCMWLAKPGSMGGRFFGEETRRGGGGDHACCEKMNHY